MGPPFHFLGAFSLGQGFFAYDQQIDKLVNEKELGQYLKVLVLYRNCCAHDERLFSHKVYSDVPDTPLHPFLGIPKNGEQYAMGKRDLFGVVVGLRYLLPPD